MVVFQIKKPPLPAPQYYWSLFHDKGAPFALTQLHCDLWKLEQHALESPQGYHPEFYELMKQYRALSVKIWTLRQNGKNSTTK